MSTGTVSSVTSMSEELELYTKCVASADFSPWIEYRHSLAAERCCSEHYPYSIVYSSIDMCNTIYTCLKQLGMETCVEYYTYSTSTKYKLLHHPSFMPRWWHFEWTEAFERGWYRDVFAADLVVYYMAYTNKIEFDNIEFFPEATTPRPPLKRESHVEAMKDKAWWCKYLPMRVMFERSSKRWYVDSSVSVMTLNICRTSVPLFALPTVAVNWKSPARMVLEGWNMNFTVATSKSLASAIIHTESFWHERILEEYPYITGLLNSGDIVTQKLSYLTEEEQHVVDNHKVTTHELGVYLLVKCCLKMGCIVSCGNQMPRYYQHSTVGHTVEDAERTDKSIDLTNPLEVNEAIRSGELQDIALVEYSVRHGVPLPYGRSQHRVCTISTPTSTIIMHC